MYGDPGAYYVKDYAGYRFSGDIQCGNFGLILRRDLFVRGEKR